MNSTVRNIAAGAAAAMAFLAAYIPLGFSLFIALPVSLAVYVAILLILHKTQPIEVSTNGVTDEEVRRVVSEGEAKIQTIRDAARSIQDTGVRDKIEAVCEAAHAIFEDFKKDPGDIKRGKQFTGYYLDAAVKIVSKYRELLSTPARTPEIEQTLKKSEDILTMIRGAFEKQLSVLLENDVMDLNAEIGLLEKTLKMEGLQ